MSDPPVLQPYPPPLPGVLIDDDTGLPTTIERLEAQYAQRRARQEALARDLGIYSAVAPIYERAPTSFDEAWAALRATYTDLPEEGLDDAVRNSLQHRDFWYVAAGWIGCRGHFVDRATRDVEIIGSALDLDEALRARVAGERPPGWRVERGSRWG